MSILRKDEGTQIEPCNVYGQEEQVSACMHVSACVCVCVRQSPYIPQIVLKLKILLPHPLKFLYLGLQIPL